MIRIPAVLHVHARIVFYPLIIDVIPALFCRKESSPIVRILPQPGRNGLVVLQRRIVVSFSLKLLQRLIKQKPEIVHTLVDGIVQRRITGVRQHVPRHTCCKPVDIIQQLFHTADGICLRIRVNLTRPGNGFFQQSQQFRIGFQVCFHCPSGVRNLQFRLRDSLRHYRTADARLEKKQRNKQRKYSSHHCHKPPCFSENS